MFRRFAGQIPGGALAIFRCHPSVLKTLLEVAWDNRMQPPNDLPLGHPYHRSNISAIPAYWLDPLRNSANIEPPQEGETPEPIPVLWDHLIYAYMIENTKIYEIFRKVIHEFLHGEKLGAPLPEAQHWLRNTEELFYRDPPPFSITTITSDIRPNIGSTRWNAYQRMFGMELNHVAGNREKFPYIQADASNGEFEKFFKEFLYESWIAITNIDNTSGTNPTDVGKIQNLVDNLRNMLLTRRVSGNLSREEFVFVSMMSWFHLTVQFNSPIIESLRAEAASPEQRLFKVAQRVGEPAHAFSKSLFDIADPISQILILIESGGLDNLPSRPDPPFTPEIQSALNAIITHWSMMTSHDIKARKVATT